jgi:hypothetical protein
MKMHGPIAPCSQGLSWGGGQQHDIGRQCAHVSSSSCACHLCALCARALTTKDLGYGQRRQWVARFVYDYDVRCECHL